MEEPEENATSPTSPALPGRMRHDSSTSYTEDIHFEPLIPLPEQIEVQTGEEQERVVFSHRAKLYRYDKDVSSWKERGIGTMKILHNSDKGRSRILMRREVVHKICANHFITADMKLEEKKGTANSWIWNTIADYSEEVAKAEQLAVKFKTQDEFLLFKEKFEECQKMTKKDTKAQGITADTSETSADLMAKFAPKPGSWSCSVCLVSNEERTTVCVACGAAQLSMGSGATTTQAPPKSEFHLPKESTTSSTSQAMFSGFQENASSGSPFVFKRSDAGPLGDSPFAFVVSSPAATSKTASSYQVFGASSESPTASKPSSSQPFVLAAFGVPAIGNESKPSTFLFDSSPATGSSPFSFSMAQNAANTAPAGASVFGGCSPEQGGLSISFGSFGTGNSPYFDLDVPESEGDDQVTPNVSIQTQLAHSQPQSSLSFNEPTSNPEISEQKLFWQQPSGIFQFGQPGAIPPLGGATSWTENNHPWCQSAQPFSKLSTFQEQGAPQTSQLFSQPHTLQGGFAPGSNVNLQYSELLRVLAAAKVNQDSVNQVSQAEGYDFTPYVIDESSEETKPLSSVAAEEYDNDDGNEVIEESESDSTEHSLSYTSTESEDGEEEIKTSVASAPKPTIQSSQVQPSFSPSQPKVITTPVKPVPIHSSQVENITPAHLPTHITGRRFLTAKSPLKGAKKQDEDCVLVYEVRASIADREKAHRLFLPLNFFNYTKHEACPGCIGCRGISGKEVNSSKQADKDSKPISITSATSEDVSKPVTSTSASHVFGDSANFGQLTFSSFKVPEGNALSGTQKKDSHKPFQGAGQQLFAESTKEAEGQDDNNLHFEAIIPLPDEIQVVTGEEGLEVLFTERAKLYRFDVDSGQWKERGVGEIKLLRHPTSGRGRVLMRREQIKKLCANHNITAGMELKPSVGSDRSWVWYTSADFADGEARPEKLAVKFKTPEIAEKFKDVFNDLKETSPSEHPIETTTTEEKKDTGCKLYEQFISTFAPGAWSCEVCYVNNKAEDSTCVACNSVKPGGDVPELSSQTSGQTATNAPVVESVEPTTFQETAVPFMFQSPGGKLLTTSQLFTIGRAEPREDRGTADDEIKLSPSKTSSPSKQAIPPPQKSSAPLSQSSLLTGLPFGTDTPSKFTFSLQVSSGSPPRKPRSPLSPTSPLSPGSPVHGDDDGPHFEPLIPLPEKVECRTGEEGQEVLFCERCKLFRYDSDASQWKERGVGDIKMLRNPNSGRYRILMRREHVFKLCANHVISADMELKPFPNSDRAWLWTTLADFSEEVTAAETVAARFRTNELASRFKETFDKALQPIADKSDSVEPVAIPEDNQLDQATEQKAEEEITVVFEKKVSEDQKDRAKRLELPTNFFGYEETSAEIETSPDQSGLITR